MKKFTCPEMGGPAECTAVFEGSTMQEVVDKGTAHVMSATDDMHKAMKEQMEKSSDEDKKKWMDEFQAKWDQKAEE